MTHSWSAQFTGTGTIDLTQRASGLSMRDAYLAASHELVTVEDDAIWSAVLAALNIFLDTVDPANTAAVTANISASGLHPGYSSVGAGFSVELRQPGKEPRNPHHWSTLATARLDVAEIGLAQVLARESIEAQGKTASNYDNQVFNALVTAAQSLTAALDPDATAFTIRVHMSAGVEADNLDALSVSLGVMSMQPVAEPAPPTTAFAPGMIILWSGLATAIPIGWALCDGTNGTPDLRGCFIIGDGIGPSSGGTVDPGAALTHDGHVVTQPEDHTSVLTHVHPITDPSHAHTEQNNSATTGGLAGWAARDTSTSGPVATGYQTAAAPTGISLAAPAGAVAALSHVGVTVSAHASHPVPKWYRLCIIIKL